MLARIDAIDDISLTTNGILLSRYAAELKDAGLRRVNVSLDTLRLGEEKTIRGVRMGSGRAALDIPHYVELFMNGRLPIDRLVTSRYPLSEINSALKALHEGEVIKPVIVF